MTKTPYTLNVLLPTLSPAAVIAIYEETRTDHKELFKGVVIKIARSEEEKILKLRDREVKHIGVNEINKDAQHKTIEVFVY